MSGAPDQEVAAQWVARITAAWNKTFEGVIEAGQLLVEAKGALPHGAFTAMVEAELPFRASTAQRLMMVARDERLANPAHAQFLPSSWTTLYELTKLSYEAFESGIERGIIRPDMERRDLAPLLLEARRRKNQALPPPDVETCTVSDLGDLMSAGLRFGTIYADPPWLYDNQGTRAATGNHYSGMAIDALCELPVGALALPDAHLHLWTTNGFLFDCPRIFAAWGFEFRTSFIWVKPEIGIGNYWRNSHEIMLTGIRGNAKRFADHSMPSWISCGRGTHSAKPEQVRALIERASPGPRLELFARAPAEGWVAWGDQIERGLLHQNAREFAA